VWQIVLSAGNLAYFWDLFQKEIHVNEWVALAATKRSQQGWGEGAARQY